MKKMAFVAAAFLHVAGVSVLPSDGSAASEKMLRERVEDKIIEVMVEELLLGRANNPVIRTGAGQLADRMVRRVFERASEIGGSGKEYFSCMLEDSAGKTVAEFFFVRNEEGKFEFIPWLSGLGAEELFGSDLKFPIKVGGIRKL